MNIFISGVLSYLGNKIFTFPPEDVDFFLPQLTLLCICNNNLAEALQPYLINRCRSSFYVSMRIIWLLNAFCPDTMIHSRKNKSLGVELRKSILYEEYKLSAIHINENNNYDSITKIKINNYYRTHNRSFSDATNFVDYNKSTNFMSCCHHKNNRYLKMPNFTLNGNIPINRINLPGTINKESQSEEETNAKVMSDCICNARRINPQYQFINRLMNIGLKLQNVPNKELKSQILINELSNLNLKLPGRVWVPIYNKPHLILRIPQQAAAVLNSRVKAPYIIYFEVLECEDIHKCPIPLKQTPSWNSLNGSNNSINFVTSNNNNLSNNIPMPLPPLINIRQTKSEENLIEYAHKNENKNQLQFTSSHGEKKVDNDNDETLTTDSDNHLEEALSRQYDAYKAYRVHKQMDNLSQISVDSSTSNDGFLYSAGEIRRRLIEALSFKGKNFTRSSEDPSAAALKEPWDQKQLRIREISPYGYLESWRLIPAIIKCGDDLRQEMLAYQVLKTLQSIWKEEEVELWLKPYNILPTSPDSGIIEPILNSISLHQIKKYSKMSLTEYFEKEFGEPTSETYLKAQNNFVKSCAAYSIVCYLMQVKDR